MSSKVELTPELVRLTQRTAERNRLPFLKQTARCIAEQAVLELDPELNFLMDNDCSLASVDALVRSVEANDIVVNGHLIDVCVLDGTAVRLPSVLAASKYTECGSLIVQLTSSSTGAVVGYVEAEQWRAGAESEPSELEVTVEVVIDPTFNLAGCLKHIEQCYKPNTNCGAASSVKGEDVLAFVRDRSCLAFDIQQAVVASCIDSVQMRENIAALDSFRDDQAPRILRDTASWESRVNRISRKIQENFPHLSVDEIAKVVKEISEQFGGQPDAPAFKERLAKVIARQQIAKRASKAAQAVLNSLVDSVAAGKQAGDTIKGLVKDKVAVESARLIKEQRDAIGMFASASAQEIGAAFKQMSLQPAYAAHSQADTSVVDNINLALELYETAALVETLLDIDLV